MASFCNDPTCSRVDLGSNDTCDSHYYKMYEHVEGRYETPKAPNHDLNRWKPVTGKITEGRQGTRDRGDLCQCGRVDINRETGFCSECPDGKNLTGLRRDKASLVTAKITDIAGARHTIPTLPLVTGKITESTFHEPERIDKLYMGRFCREPQCCETRDLTAGLCLFHKV